LVAEVIYGEAELTWCILRLEFREKLEEDCLRNLSFAELALLRWWTEQLLAAICADDSHPEEVFAAEDLDGAK